MKETSRRFVRETVFTTALAFTLISIAFVAFWAFFDEEAKEFTRATFFRWYFLKLVCIFLFSLSLGLINRIFLLKRAPRAVLHLVRFGLVTLSYALIMILLFYNITRLEGMDGVTVQRALVASVFYLVAYFLTLGITALGRKIFLREEKEFKSILD